MDVRSLFLYKKHFGVLMMKYLILDHLEATAARLPHKTAFADEGSAVTFAELVRLSRAVGSALCARVSPRTTVGFYMDKSVQTVAGFFGAVYAGCAYSQLNLRHPAARIRAILETLASPVVVTDRAHEDALRASSRICAKARLTRPRCLACARRCWTSTRSTSTSPPAPPARPRG